MLAAAAARRASRLGFVRQYARSFASSFDDDGSQDGWKAILAEGVGHQNAAFLLRGKNEPRDLDKVMKELIVYGGISKHNSPRIKHKMLSEKAAVDTFLELYNNYPSSEGGASIFSRWVLSKDIRVKIFFHTQILANRDDGLRVLLKVCEDMDTHKSNISRKLNEVKETDSLADIEKKRRELEKLHNNREMLTKSLEVLCSRSTTYINRISAETGEYALERLVHAEFVHPVDSVEGMVERCEAPNGMCLGLFSHSLGPQDPLAYVSIHFGHSVPGEMTQVAPGPSEGLPTVATFWSINVVEHGFRGNNLGRLLLTRAIEHFNTFQPSITEFVTLSPLYNFREWMGKNPKIANVQKILDPEWFSKFKEVWSLRTDQCVVAFCAELARDSQYAWLDESEERLEALRPILCGFAKYYIDAGGHYRKKRCKVATFHLTNGASLSRVNWAADLSQRGLHRSMGIMINYRYDPKTRWHNHRHFAMKPYDLKEKLRRRANHQPQNQIQSGNHDNKVAQSKVDAAQPPRGDLLFGQENALLARTT